MIRFLLTCVILASACVVGAVMVGKFVGDPGLNAKPPVPVREKPPADKPDDPPADNPKPADKPGSTDRDGDPVKVTPIAARVGAVEGLIIQGARVLPGEKQEVPGRRDGQILVLGTPVAPGTHVPKHKLVAFTVTMLAVRYDPAKVKVEKSEILIDKDNPTIPYRRARRTDSFAPGTTKMIPVEYRFRKLSMDEEVKVDQILGVIDPTIASEEVAVKQSRVQTALSERNAAEAMVLEYERRLEAYRAAKGGISKDDYYATEASLLKSKAESTSKETQIAQAQRELSAAWTTMDQYLIRASIPGRVRQMYRSTGDAVKTLEPVLQIQNSEELKVEAQIEVQASLPLRTRMKQAEKLRDKARDLEEINGPGDADAAKALREQAKALLSVVIEASRPEPPKAVLSGHLAAVNCVAVTGGPTARVFSGDEAGMVRAWERAAAGGWQERMRLNHGDKVSVRALACTTSPKAAHKILVTATSAGGVRLFDLDKLADGGELLKTRHGAAVNCIAVSADGSSFATGGDDRTILLWDTATKSVKATRKAAHNQGVTSLAFTPDNKLVSAGRDKQMFVWKLSADGKALEHEEKFPLRSGDVHQLGVDPAGKNVLFDEGRELKILSLDGSRIEGSIVNPGASGAFSILAQFSPSGDAILTNGNAPGRLQLWRAPSATTRAAELRQYLWSTGTVKCAAFDPNGTFVATGTEDNKVLIWETPGKSETEKPLVGELNYVEEMLDAGLQRTTIRATVMNPGWVIPGVQATILVPNLGK